MTPKKSQNAHKLCSGTQWGRAAAELHMSLQSYLPLPKKASPDAKLHTSLQPKEDAEIVDPHCGIFLRGARCLQPTELINTFHSYTHFGVDTFPATLN